MFRRRLRGLFYFVSLFFFVSFVRPLRTCIGAVVGYVVVLRNKHPLFFVLMFDSESFICLVMHVFCVNCGTGFTFQIQPLLTF